MKTIAQFVSSGIKTLADLKDALQTAMQLEFSTIPPYLCAQWSINTDKDPSGVSDRIQDIVVQEMYHFALAGNMLTAIGGVPDIANAAFIPSYPTNELPGGIHQALAVDLKPLTPEQVQVFMQIEYPEFTPVAFAKNKGPATIGDFYDTIAAGFTAVSPAIVAGAYAVEYGEATPIKSIADAQAAISLIKAEGEGAPGNPNQPAQGSTTKAHYYVFKEILTQKSLVQDAAGKWSFTGAPVQFPTVFDFQPSTATPDPSLAFNQALAQLLTGLQSCWTSGADLSLDDMFKLQSVGTTLIQQGIRPEFVWPSQA
jgi:hypothetical protein